MKATTTKPSLLIALALLAGSFGWSMAHLWSRWFDTQMPLPELTAVVMWSLTVSLVIWTVSARRRINPKPGQPRMHPLVAARSAALALAASRTGALVFGFYLGVLIVNLNHLQSDAGHSRVIICGLVIVASACLVATALWLEKICQIPKPPVDEKSVATSA